jgi:endo-1,3-1,4-beta-glycanase ExoK
MRIYVNAWFPRWLAGKRPLTDHYVLVDQIRHTGP